MSPPKSGGDVSATGGADGAEDGVAVLATDGVGAAEVGASPAGVALGRVVPGAAPEQPTNKTVTNDITAIAWRVGFRTVGSPLRLEPQLYAATISVATLRALHRAHDGLSGMWHLSRCRGGVTQHDGPTLL